MDLEKNNVEIIGIVFSDPVLSHKVYEEEFYTFILKADRLSNIADYINITVSEHILEAVNLIMGDVVAIYGQFRSYNNYSGVGNKLMLTVFAKDIHKLEQDTEHVNNIGINGYICKEPIFRVTPFGREITDLLVAVNRTYHKSDYIPCIAWGQNAKTAASFSIGANIYIEGRVQSRNYQKKINDEEIVSRTAYEVSISKIEAVEVTENID